MGPFPATEEFKKKIDALSKEELREIVDKGERLSPYKGERFAYCQTRLATLEQQGKDEQRQQEVSHKQEELSLAREANQIAREANQISRKANNQSLIAIIISFISMILAIIVLCKH